MRRHEGVLEMMEEGERRAEGKTLETQAGRRRWGLSSEAAGTLTENPQNVSWSREGWIGKGGKEEKWNLGCALKGKVRLKNYTHGNRQRESDWE